MACTKRGSVKSACQCAERIILHVLGQSNGCGRAPKPSGIVPVGWFLPNGDVLTEDNSPNDRNNVYGVEMPLTQCLPAVCRGSYLVKTCQSSASIPQLEPMTAQHIATAQSLEISAPPQCPPAINRHIAVWIQGETEANGNGNGPQNYQQDEADYFAPFIAAFPDIEIFSVLLNPVIPFADVALVNAAKQANAAAIPNMTTIGPYTVGVDNVHYDNFDDMAADICAAVTS